MNLKIIFLNFIWKTKIHKIIGNSQWNKAFLQNKIITYIIQILNIIEDSFKKLHMKSLLLQQNACGRPFSFKKHEEMFCDFAKTSGFFGESRHTKCISLGEMHIQDFSLNRKQADFSGQNSKIWRPEKSKIDWKFCMIWFNSGSWNQCSKWKGWSSFTQLWRSTNWRVLGPVGEETGGVSNHHTPDGLV